MKFQNTSLENFQKSYLNYETFFKKLQEQYFETLLPGSK